MHATSQSSRFQATLVTAVVAAAVGATALGVGAAPPAQAATPNTNATDTATTRVLVMGDSYSSGVGAVPASQYTDSVGCGRTPKNYGHVFTKSVRSTGQDARVRTIACGGAVIDNLTGTQTTSTATVPAQLKAVNDSYDVILATIGGNDAGFSHLVQFCLIHATVQGVTLPVPSLCASSLTNAEQQVGSAKTLSSPIGKAGLKALLAIHAKAPSAKIVLIGYPLLEGNTDYTVGTGDGAIAVGQRLATLQQRADALQKRLADTANAKVPGSPFGFVGTRALFSGPPFHGLYASDPLSTPNPNRWMVAPADLAALGNVGLYHPNTEGWQQIGELLAASTSVVPHTPKASIVATSATTRVGAKVTAGLRTTDGRSGTWAVTARTLPPGVHLSGSSLAGTPTTPGRYAIATSFTDGYGRVVNSTTVMVVRKR